MIHQDGASVVVNDKALSIIIVNWRSCDFLRQCLRSIYANAKGMSFEVIVVDNASYDGSREMLAREFPEVYFIQSAKNLGFGRANNLGYKNSCGRSLLFLNPDTEIIGNALAKLESALQLVPDAGIVGARLLNPDSSLQTSCVQAFPSIWNQVLDVEAFRQRFPKASLWGTRVLFENRQGPAQVDTVSGACLMIKRKVFESVKMFSPEYFMYSEDLDLCFKVARAGWKNYYLSGAMVIHHGGRSSGAMNESSFATVMMRESLRRFFRIRRSKVHAVLYQSVMGIVAICRLSLIASILLVTPGRLQRDSRLGALAKWFSVLRWSVGLEARGRRPA